MTHDPGPSALTRRRRLVLGAALGAGLLSVGGLAGSVFVRSPAQAVADTRAPDATAITALVKRQQLVKTIVFRGDFTTGRLIPVTPTSVAATKGLDGSTDPGASVLTVTRVLTRQNDRVEAAHPIAEVSGRPVFALPGSMPGYRDLTPGLTGQDVAQLQDSLGELGLYAGGDTRGWFGPATKRAVVGLYRKVGYPAPVTGPETAQAVQAAQAAYDEQLALVQSLRTGGTESAGAGAGSGTAASPETSGAAGTAPPAPAGDDASARKRLAQARKARDAAVAREGVMVPLSEMVFVPHLPARVASSPTGVGRQIKGPVVTLAASGPRLLGYLDPLLGSRVRPGAEVEVTSEALGTHAKGSVASVGTLVNPADGKEKSETDGAPASAANGGVPYLPVIVTPAKGKEWDSRLDGQNVRITITSALTKSVVLAVPQAAIRSGADTRTTVTVVGRNGTERVVQVTAGVSADGLVQVEPVVDGTLADGDKVVVGR
ncbi:peptidoglycan-binding protein [Streptomyces sp. NPDC005780]|uniref:peptidoglycan-binding protein n=1 Tax=Streptomyces sp. NPDC005780 TaxID=3364730 RepID=UPI003685BE23